ncbi:lysophospholipid acyltransferase family protein [uncultured Helicobacter sp.]|uniref:lysophospholipid acyltransferase family protein n=1 Tax=uncultured Helicobacter sp. TaxID=175537 RepID=UPI00261531F6|nr:lysophospholipid acyltransferase family protein [uncultured Helicobacter sp.]
MLSRETKRRILSKIPPPLMYGILRLLYVLTRHRFHINEYAKTHNFIGAFWHGELLMLPFLYKYFQKHVSKERDKGFYIVLSHHFDASIMAKVCAMFGLKNVRGSSSRGGLKVLIDAFGLLNNGYDVALSPDGPKGPYHSIGDGVVAMSQKTGKLIIPLRVVCSRYWELKSWDKFRIPKPFSRVDYYMLDGFVIDKNMNVEEAKVLVRTHLEKEL